MNICAPQLMSYYMGRLDYFPLIKDLWSTVKGFMI